MKNASFGPSFRANETHSKYFDNFLIYRPMIVRVRSRTKVANDVDASSKNRLQLVLAASENLKKIKIKKSFAVHESTVAAQRMSTANSDSPFRRFSRYREIHFQTCKLSNSNTSIGCRARVASCFDGILNYVAVASHCMRY